MSRRSLARKIRRDGLRRARRALRRDGRTPAPPAARARYVVEPIEPRLLLSADINPAVGQALDDGLDTLGDWLDQIQHVGDLADDLPLVGDSVSDLVGMADALRTGLIDMLRNELPTDLSDPTALSDDVAAAMNGIAGATVTDESTADEVRFDVSFDFSKTVDVPLDLGQAAAAAGIDLDATLQLLASVDFDFDFGFHLDPTLSPEEAFFVQVDNLTAGVEVTGFVDGGVSSPTLATGFDLGIVSAKIQGGEISLTAALALDPDTSGDGVVSLEELLSSGLSTDAISVAPSTSFSASLPVLVDVDPSFAFDLSHGVNVAISGIDASNLFDLPDFDISLDVPDVAGIGFDPSDFAHASPGDLVGLLAGLGNQLQVLADGLNPEGGIPFVSDAIAQVVDYAHMIQNVLDPLFDAAVNGVSDAVADLSGASVDFDVVVDGVSTHVDNIAAIDHGSVQDLAQAITDAFAGKGLDLEAVIEQGQLQIRSLGNDVLEFSLENVSADAQSLLGLESETLSTPLFNFHTIQDFQDVLNSVSGLLDTALHAVYDAANNTIGFSLDLTRSFSESLHIAFEESIDLGIADLSLLATGSVMAAGEASLRLDLGLDLQGLLPDTDLDQLNGGRGVRTDGSGGPDLNIALRMEGADPMDPPVAAFGVDLDGAVTLGDVISAIETAATNAGQTLSVDLDPGAGLVIEGPSGLVVEVALAPGSFAAFDLGFGVLSSAVDRVAGAQVLERIFVADTSGISADFTLGTPEPIVGVASVGFLQAEVSAQLTTPISLSVEVGLRDPNSDGRITFVELGSHEGGGEGPLSAIDVASYDLDLTGGALQIDLKLGGAEEFGLDDVSVTTITGTLSDLGTTVGIDFDIDDLNLESVLEQFQNLSLADVVALVTQIAQTLQHDLGFLAADLPFLGSSLTDLLSLVGDSGLGDLSNLRELLNPALGDAAAAAGGLLNLPMFASFLADGFDVDSVASDVQLRALEVLGQLADIDPSRFGGLQDDLIAAYDAIDGAVRALPDVFDLAENPVRLFTAFQALLVVTDRMRSVEQSQLDQLVGKTIGTATQLQDAFTSFRQQLLEAVYGVAGSADPDAAGLRELIPSGDAILERLFEALGFTLPAPSAATLDTLDSLIQGGLDALSTVRGALETANGSLPSGTPSEVGDALTAAIAAIDELAGTAPDADGLMERAQALISKLGSFVDAGLDIATADLVRTFELVTDAVSSVGGAVSQVADAIQAIDDLNVGDLTQDIEDLRDDVLIPQRDALIDQVQSAVSDAVSDVLREFSGRLLTLSFSDGALVANLHYDADIIGEVLGLPDTFLLDFSLSDDVPIGFDVDISGTLELSGAFDLGFGIAANGLSAPDFFLVAGSSIGLQAMVDIEGEIAVSLFGFDVASLGGSGSPATLMLTNQAMDGPAELSVTLDDTGAVDGRVILGTDPIDLTPNFDAKIDVHLPIFVGGTQVDVSGTPLEIGLSTNLSDLSSFDPMLDLPTGGAQAILDAILANGLNLAQILDAIEAFMRVLEQGLGNDAVKDLPIVGDAAGDVAGGIEQFRTGFFEPVRDQLESVLAGLNDADAIEGAIEDLVRSALEAIDGDTSTPVDPDPSDLSDVMTIEIGLGTLSVDVGLTTGDPTMVLFDPDTELTFGLSWDFHEEREFFFDLGLAALDFASLETEGSVILALQAMVGATIGLNREGVFLEFDDQDGGTPGLQPIDASISVGLAPGSSIAAKLFFLELSATAYDEAADVARLGDAASAKVQEGVSLTGSLAVEVPDMRFTVADLDDLSFQPVLSAALDIDLLLDLSVGNDDLPSLDVVLDIDWDAFSTDGGGGDPSLQFFNLRLDMGSFLGGALGQVVEGLDKFIEPIRPVLEILGTPIPVISDLAQLLGQDPITFGDAIALLGSGAESITPLVTALETIDTIVGFIDMIDTSGGFVIDFGDLDLSGIGDQLTNIANIGSIGQTALGSGVFGNLPDLSQITSGSSGDAGTDAFFGETTSNAGFSGGALAFPLFQDPTKLFTLLFGGREDLILWDIPKLSAEFGFQYSFGPILPPVPLFATIAGSLEIFAKFAVGFDTRGFESGQNFFDGFHFEDLAVAPNPVDFDHTGEDILELGLIARFSAGAKLSVVVASAGVEGGIEAKIGANWHDNDGDGRVYLDEVAFNFNRGIDCVFDFEGKLSAFFDAFVKLGFDTPFGFVTLFEATLNLVNVTLLDFEHTCPPLPPPVPATLDGQDVLLNIGDRAEFRQPGAQDVDESIFVIAERHFYDANGMELPVVPLTDLNGNGEYEEAEILAANDYDGDGIISNDTVLVFGFGQTAIFQNVARIIGNAGRGDDEIEIDPSVVAAAILTGGSGDDKIQGGSGMDDISGDAGFESDAPGNDVLLGGAGMDVIRGNGGDDTIKGEEGDDKLFGGDGMDTIAGNQGLNQAPDLVADPDFTDDDTIDGGAGQDDLRGDWGTDTIAGGSGADSIQGGFGDDSIWGDGSIAEGTWVVTASPNAGESDLIEGGEGSDTIHGGGGNDILFGEGARVAVGNGGDDTIYGDDGNDTIRDGYLSDEGEEGVEQGNDSFFGGQGDDQLVTQSGNDRAFGGSGNDEILTGDGADYVEGNGGADRIRTGEGDDRIIGGSRLNAAGVAAIDTSSSTLWDDALTGHFSSDDPADNGSSTDLADDIESGAGNDLVIGDNGAFFDGATQSTHATDGVTLITTFSRGGNGADRILAGSDDDRVFGGGGGDTIYADDFGGSGADIVVGDQGMMNAAILVAASSNLGSASGDDDIQGQGGNDILLGGDGSDVLGGSAGRDILVGDNGEVDILGTAGQDVPVVPVVLEIRSRDFASGGDDRILGNQGSDIALGGFGDDFVSGGGTGDVATLGDPSPDILLGDHGVVRVDPASDDHDVFSFDDPDAIDPANNGADRILGSGRNDILIGGGNDDYLQGLTGNDVILGDHGYVDRDGEDTILTIQTVFPASGGSDEAYGDAGNDIVMGGADGDELHGGDDDDTILGDNGRVDWIDPVLDPSQDASTLDLITTTDPNDGGMDLIFGDDGDDVAFGGTDSDEIHGGNDDDLLFGDHGKREVQAPANMNFFAIDTQAGDGGDDDEIYGEAGNDILLGQQGDDVMFGGSEDDDLIGGHNVAGGIDEIDAIDDGRNDTMDGGAGFDLLAGDNAIVIRQALADGTLISSLSPRFRELADSLLYAADGSANVDGASQEDPDAPRPVGRDVTLLDHDDATALLSGVRPFGADVIYGGGDDDVLFGQLDSDRMHGDGAIDETTLVEDGSERASDGDDYLEGNGGGDLMWGGLGQDDLIGGSSDLFGLGLASQRPDGSDVIFGGAGTRTARNEFVGDADPQIAPGDRNARDSDMILGDNGRIFRIVDASGPETEHLRFAYDTSDAGRTSHLVVRAVDLLDYDPADVGASRGAADLVHGESGDDFVHGMTGNDVLYGDSDNDDIFGENGGDWVSGGTGEDAILGDDGKIATSRGGVAEPLYGIAATTEEFVSTPANVLQATLDPTGELKRTVDLEPFDVGYDDVLYGGLGDDAVHGGAGNDGISGAEALPALYAAPSTASVIEVAADGRIVARELGVVIEEFYSYTNALPRIDGHPLNFVTNDVGADPVKGDGEDFLFGDLGLDWLVGGSGRDRMYGGLGNDILNADDDLDTNGGLNDVSDTGVLVPSENADIAYGGGGLDLLIGNTGADRLIDWTGEFNEYQVPFAPFGIGTVIRDLAPWLSDFLYDVSESDGADPTRVGAGLGTANRNGEPYGELGLVRPQDPEWQEQHGGPYGGQAGNSPGQQKDTLGDNFGGGGANGVAIDLPPGDGGSGSAQPVMDGGSAGSAQPVLDGGSADAAPLDAGLDAGLSAGVGGRGTGGLLWTAGIHPSDLSQAFASFSEHTLDAHTAGFPAAAALHPEGAHFALADGAVHGADAALVHPRAVAGGVPGAPERVALHGLETAAAARPLRVETFDPAAPHLAWAERPTGAHEPHLDVLDGLAVYSPRSGQRLPVADLVADVSEGEAAGTPLMEAALGGLSLALAMSLEQRRREAPGGSGAAPTIDW